MHAWLHAACRMHAVSLTAVEIDKCMPVLNTFGIDWAIGRTRSHFHQAHRTPFYTVRNVSLLQWRHLRILLTIDRCFSSNGMYCLASTFKNHGMVIPSSFSAKVMSLEPGYHSFCIALSLVSLTQVAPKSPLRANLYHQ